MNKARIKELVSIFILKSLIVTVITLILLIAIKSSVNVKTFIYKYVYDTNFEFAKFNNLYNKYFKDFNKREKIEKVSNEKIDYTSKEKYEEGVKINVSSNYSVKAQESGIIVFIGNKDKYNNSIIVQQVNGIDLLYGNIGDSNYSLYDYVKAGDIIGVSNKVLYLVYKKDGKVLDYEKYI